MLVRSLTKAERKAFAMRCGEFSEASDGKRYLAVYFGCTGNPTGIS